MAVWLVVVSIASCEALDTRSKERSVCSVDLASVDEVFDPHRARGCWDLLGLLVALAAAGLAEATGGDWFAAGRAALAVPARGAGGSDLATLGMVQVATKGRCGAAPRCTTSAKEALSANEGMPVIVSCRSLSQKVVGDVPGRPSSVTASKFPAKAAVNVFSDDKAISAPPYNTSGKVSCPKTHRCQLCPYVARYPSILAQHVRTHTNERPYKCDVCGLTFKRDHHLLVHQRIHTGEKQYKCSVCSHACVTKFALETHMRRHTGEKPYQCTHCPARFAYNYQLKYHMLQKEHG
ncbi:hypothetical protein HPB51_026605 [Rhipicephalus microplus]|uniref:C2H2-type domain-containing protein n=1 Tax=Rhipicephalus microplus TaxID=6941 RepID=A0A9J6D2M1_RHIMP|nr:hypothetical protein HPB51_026605 [Rhipicephalus microplus]